MSAKLVAAFAAVTLLFVTNAPKAADVTFYYGGEITVGTASSSVLSAGALFSGSYTFDSLATDYDGSASVGRYGLSAFSLTYGGTTYAGTASGLGIGVYDDWGSSPVKDWYFVDEYYGSLSTGTTDWALQSVLLALSDTDATIFGGTELPLTPPSLAAFETNEAIFDFFASGVGGDRATGVLTYLSTTPPISPIPEPETYAMLLAGLGLLGWHARRRKLTQTA